MRKLVLTLVALIAVVTFIRAYDIPSLTASATGDLRESPQQARVER